jgi:hypothetical protein
MSETTTRQRVGAEYVGLARVFRAAVQQVDQRCHDTLVDIAQPLRERLARKPRLRPEHVFEAIRSYHALVPVECRIGALQGARGGKTDFIVQETRLMPSRLKCDDWGDDEFPEPGVSLCTQWFGTKDGRLLHRVQPRTAVSLHALARFFERSGVRDHATLIGEIAALADADEKRDATPTPSGGLWLGTIITANGDDGAIRLRDVRTWVSQ